MVPGTDSLAMSRPPRDSNWELLSNHGKVLVCVARDPDIRVSEIADIVGIKERAVQRILAELRDDGLLVSERFGRRNHYRINRTRRVPWTEAPVGKLLDVLKS
jgi:DNA-binding MarR family transcriptional regulator